MVTLFVAESVWAGGLIALAGVAVGAVLGFVLAELSDYLRRHRETQAAAVLVYQELVSAYSDARGVMAAFVEHPEEIYPRRVAWESHGIAVARALSLEDAHRVARAYSALDDLDRILRAGAPREQFAKPEEREWLQTNVVNDLLVAIKVVARLAGLDEQTVNERLAATEKRKLDDRSGRDGSECR